jgi:hypothetical protein
VRETLSEDDKVVRRLHAEEVLKLNLASLDCAWPRETGTKHGGGAEPRTAKKARKPEVLELKEKPAAPSPKKAEKPQAPASSSSSERAKGSSNANLKGRRPASKKAAAQPAPTASARARLTREASVVDAPSIGPKTAGKLSLIGVKTVGDLLEVSPEDAAARIKQGHINARIIKDWQAQALLACTVPDLPALGAQLLVGAGVSSVDDLASADPDFLVDAIAMFAASGDGERALRGQAPPDRERLKSWIEAALVICENRSAA